MEELKKDFLENGWLILDLPDPRPVFQTREFLRNQLMQHMGRKMLLEEYHLYIHDDDEHTQLQIKITSSFRQAGLGPAILAAQCAWFKELIGPDLLIQANPYLRITRPQCPQDNIGYHRDTFYGGSPYELSVFVPFVDLPPECSLSVLSGSHIHPETFYPTTQIDNPDVTVKKGAPKHQLGFLYAPKMLESSIDERMKPISLKVGQALIFSLSTLHGSTVNRGHISRWSSDMRIMNGLAPVDLSARPDYYQLLSQSVITEGAKKYFYANRKENRNNVELELCHTTSGK
jgi:hypothetical protein